jgi:magnesium-transporting ATPase (P-type)
MDPYEILSSPSTTQSIGLSHNQHLTRLISFGSNHIDTRKSSPFKKIFAELRKPIHAFQILVFAFWIAKSYYIYAFLFLILVIVSFIAHIFEKNDSKKIIKQLIKTYGPEVRVTRDGQSFMAGSASLVPGDLVQITGRITLPCDLVLIEGTMDVDESTITGDTVPAQKVAFKGGDSNEALRSSASYIQQENTLIGGTRVLSVKYALAVVVRTGFNTSRGKVIRTLLSQKQDTSHSYASDLNRFIITFMICSFINTFAMIMYKIFYLRRSGDPILSFLDLFVCTVPPFMPLVLIMPLYIAARRLRKSRIKCTSLLGLMKMGTVDCICYDKTGTMTEESLALYGTIEAMRKKLIQNNPSFAPMRESPLDMSRDAISVMAACHNLVRVNDQVMGDKLEEALFKRCGYQLEREKTENRFMVHPPPCFNHRGVSHCNTIITDP